MAAFEIDQAQVERLAAGAPPPDVLVAQAVEVFAGVDPDELFGPPAADRDVA